MDMDRIIIGKNYRSAESPISTICVLRMDGEVEGVRGDLPGVLLQVGVLLNGIRTPPRACPRRV